MPPPELTIAICAHNPRQEVLAGTLESLRTRAAGEFRLEHLVLDNVSREPLTDSEGYLKRAAGLWLKWLRPPPDADADARVRTDFQRAFDRGLRRSLVRLAFGPPIWRGVPSLTPGQ